MLDLATALKDQEDLAALCEVPEDDRLTDLATYNDFYGFASILRGYAGYPAELPVKAIIPHGVYYDATELLDMELKSKYRAVLNYPAFRAAAWESQRERVAIPSASPFLYALASFREQFEPPADRKGTFFLTSHTCQTMRTSANWGAVAEELLALPDEFHPISVCMYYVDYRKGLAEQFERRGMRVVSAGHNADPQFMFRWLHLLSQHCHVLSNDVGSGVIYAAAAGMPVTLLADIAVQFFDPAVHAVLGQGRSDQARQTQERVIGLFRAEDPETEKARDEVVDYLLGRENFKSREGLRRDLEYCAELGEL